MVSLHKPLEFALQSVLPNQPLPGSLPGSFSFTGTDGLVNGLTAQADEGSRGSLTFDTSCPSVVLDPYALSVVSRSLGGTGSLNNRRPSLSTHSSLPDISLASDTRAVIDRTTVPTEAASFRLKATIDLFIKKESFNAVKLKPVGLSKIWINLIPHEKRSDFQDGQLASMKLQSRGDPQHHRDQKDIKSIPIYLRELLLVEARKAILRHLFKVDPSILQYFPGYRSVVPGENHQKESDSALSPKQKELKPPEQRQLEQLQSLPFSATYSPYTSVLKKVMDPYFQKAGEFNLEFSLKKRPAEVEENSTWELLVSGVKVSSAPDVGTLSSESEASIA
jgi:hypothetical protein